MQEEDKNVGLNLSSLDSNNVTNSNVMSSKNVTSSKIMNSQNVTINVQNDRVVNNETQFSTKTNVQFWQQKTDGSSDSEFMIDDKHSMQSKNLATQTRKKNENSKSPSINDTT